MGVAGLLRWVMQRFSRSAHLSEGGDGEMWDEIWIDANAIIHGVSGAVGLSLGQKEAKRRHDLAFDRPDGGMEWVEEELDMLLRAVARRIRVGGLLVIALDGVPSQAKRKLQRARRYAIEMDTGDHETRQIVIPTAAITPGTRFMAALASWCRQWAGRAASTGRVRVAFSSTANPGEGEHKLFAGIGGRAGYRLPGVGPTPQPSARPGEAGDEQGDAARGASTGDGVGAVEKGVNEEEEEQVVEEEEEEEDEEQDQEGAAAGAGGGKGGADERPRHHRHRRTRILVWSPDGDAVLLGLSAQVGRPDADVFVARSADKVARRIFKRFRGKKKSRPRMQRERRGRGPVAGFVPKHRDDEQAAGESAEDRSAREASAGFWNRVISSQLMDMTNFLIIDCWRLEQSLHSWMGIDQGKTGAGLDLLVMSFLCGNDFLPELPGFAVRDDGLDKVVKQYQLLFRRDPVNRKQRSIHKGGKKKKARAIEPAADGDDEAAGPEAVPGSGARLVERVPDCPWLCWRLSESGMRVLLGSLGEAELANATTALEGLHSFGTAAAGFGGEDSGDSDDQDGDGGDGGGGMFAAFGDDDADGAFYEEGDEEEAAALREAEALADAQEAEEAAERAPIEDWLRGCNRPDLEYKQEHYGARCGFAEAAATGEPNTRVQVPDVAALVSDWWKVLGWGVGLYCGAARADGVGGDAYRGWFAPFASDAIGGAGPSAPAWQWPELGGDPALGPPGPLPALASVLGPFWQEKLLPAALYQRMQAHLASDALYDGRTWQQWFPPPPTLIIDDEDAKAAWQAIICAPVLPNTVAERLAHDTADIVAGGVWSQAILLRNETEPEPWEWFDPAEAAACQS